MTDAPLILSASSISTYLSCGYRYLLGSIYRLSGEPNMAASIGSAVHLGIAMLHLGTAAPETPVDALRRSLAADVAQMTPPYSEDPSVALRDALTMLAVYRKKVWPTFKPTLVEAPFVISVDGILFSGQIDAADEDVRDVKTTAGMTINSKKPSQFKPDRHRFQLTGYGLGYKWLTGKSPRRYIIDLLTRRGAYRQYIVEPDVGEFMEVLGVASDGILSETFEPTGVSNGECRYCPFLDHGCKYGAID